VPPYEAVQFDIEAGTTRVVDMPDGSHIVVHKLSEKDHDPGNRIAALNILAKDRADQGHVFTGLIYYDNTSNAPLEDLMHLPDTALAAMDEDMTRPSRETFDDMLTRYR
jgi:hypothetical protein